MIRCLFRRGLGCIARWSSAGLLGGLYFACSRASADGQILPGLEVARTPSSYDDCTRVNFAYRHFDTTSEGCYHLQTHHKMLLELLSSAIVCSRYPEL